MKEEKKEITLTSEEQQAIEIKRKDDEKIRLCAEEVNLVLEKHQMILQMFGQPQIVIIPKR